jgi:hypothetical protein
LHIFPCFVPCFRSYHDLLIFLVFSFLDIFKFLQCVFLIFHIFHFSLHIPGPNEYISHFHVFQCFSPYSRSYSVCV